SSLNPQLDTSILFHHSPLYNLIRFTISNTSTCIRVPIHNAQIYVKAEKRR
ncbi:4276_t:CDS:1, partial [Acaulospora colombiana]